MATQSRCHSSSSTGSEGKSNSKKKTPKNNNAWSKIKTGKSLTEGGGEWGSVVSPYQLLSAASALVLFPCSTVALHSQWVPWDSSTSLAGPFQRESLQGCLDPPPRVCRAVSHTFFCPSHSLAGTVLPFLHCALPRCACPCRRG